MLRSFQIATATVIGREHVRLGRNNQDALLARRSDDVIVTVVCDGCSSGAHSEVGAKIGARLCAASVVRRVASASPADAPFWDGVRDDVLAGLGAVAAAWADEIEHAVRDALLFTIVGAVVTPEVARVFAVGDGLYAVDGAITRIGPFENNAPPYLGYALLTGEREPCGFVLADPVPTQALRSLLVATDGAADLLDAAEQRLPGGVERVGPLSALWEHDRFFLNPDALRRRLTQIAREHVATEPGTGRLVRTAGLLPDDTTIVVVRRAPSRPDYRG